MIAHFSGNVFFRDSPEFRQACTWNSRDVGNVWPRRPGMPYDTMTGPKSARKASKNLNFWASQSVEDAHTEVSHSKSVVRCSTPVQPPSLSNKRSSAHRAAERTQDAMRIRVGAQAQAPAVATGKDTAAAAAESKDRDDSEDGKAPYKERQREVLAEAVDAAPEADEEEEKESDSASSAATEGFNSEDEHGGRAGGDVGMRTLQERESKFCAELAKKGMQIVHMRADGNCLFRALAHCLWGDQERHGQLRASVMEYVVKERDYYSQFIAEDFARYIRRKRREGCFGNHLELQAASELFARSIEVYSYSSTPAQIIDCWGTSSSREVEPLRLSYHTQGNHYNSIQPIVTTIDKWAQKLSHREVSDAEVLAVADALATEEEMERAVLALSLAEARRDVASARGAGSSSSASPMPSSILALMDVGYSEQNAREAYRVAGHLGLHEMVRFLSPPKRAHHNNSQLPGSAVTRNASHHGAGPSSLPPASSSFGAGGAAAASSVASHESLNGFMHHGEVESGSGASLPPASSLASLLPREGKTANVDENETSE